MVSQIQASFCAVVMAISLYLLIRTGKVVNAPDLRTEISSTVDELIQAAEHSMMNDRARVVLT